MGFIFFPGDVKYLQMILWAPGRANRVGGICPLWPKEAFFHRAPFSPISSRVIYLHDKIPKNQLFPTLAYRQSENTFRKHCPTKFFMH